MQFRACCPRLGTIQPCSISTVRQSRTLHQRMLKRIFTLKEKALFVVSAFAAMMMVTDMKEVISVALWQTRSSDRQVLIRRQVTKFAKSTKRPTIYSQGHIGHVNYATICTRLPQPLHM